MAHKPPYIKGVEYMEMHGGWARLRQKKALDGIKAKSDLKIKCECDNLAAPIKTGPNYTK